MEFQNWTLAKNGISSQKWNSKIGPWPKMEFQIFWPKMEFQNWTLAENGIPKLDPG